MGPGVRGRGSWCWSTWARWTGAGRRRAEAGMSREGKWGRTGTRGRVPRCRRVGSSCTQLGSAALLDASQVPARKPQNNETEGYVSQWRL